MWADEIPKSHGQDVPRRKAGLHYRSTPAEHSGWSQSEECCPLQEHAEPGKKRFGESREKHPAETEENHLPEPVKRPPATI
jgi:hypothetical protein